MSSFYLLKCQAKCQIFKTLKPISTPIENPVKLLSKKANLISQWEQKFCNKWITSEDVFLDLGILNKL